MKTNKSIIKHFRLVEMSIGWLREGANLHGFALAECKPLISHLSKVFHTRGVAAGIAYTKAVRGDLMNYLSGNPLRSKIVRLSAGGVPTCLGPLRKYVQAQDPEILRIVLTILFSTRALKLEASPDLEPITAPSKRGASSFGISLWARDFWKQIGYHHSGSLPNSLKFKRFHFSTKTGPNGHALNSWYADLLQLPDRLVESIGVMGGEKLISFMSLCRSNHLLRGFFPTAGSRFRKLSAFADKEGKTRVIAIGDYFSQAVLKRLHSYLFRALRRIPQDMTFDQGAFVEHVKDWPVFYSVDLTAATDRFPVDLIHNVLAAHLPANYVSAWRDIMVGYPFEFISKGKTFNVSYTVGNPMGFYSSWASFALAHHYIMYHISRILGKDFKTLPYCLLGDDIIIGDKLVGELYLETMKSLGVDVSMAKTHVSTTTLEFAKRWIHKGREISPFPISALKECGKKYYFLTALLLQQVERGWVIDVSEMVGSFYGRFLSRSRRFRASMVEKSFISGAIMEIVTGTKPATLLNEISRKLGFNQVTNLSEWSANTILADVSLDLFTDSDPALKDKGKPLGLLAEQLLMLITGALEKEPEAWGLLENPLLHAYGSVEQTYLDMLKLSKGLQTNLQGKWPVLLRNMTIPLSDALFIDRAEQTTAMACSRVAGKVAEYLQFYNMSPRDIPRDHILGPKGPLATGPIQTFEPPPK